MHNLFQRLQRFLIAFLCQLCVTQPMGFQTDLDGNLYSTPNCHTSAKIESYLSHFFPSHQDKKTSGSMFNQLLLHPATTNNLVEFITEMAVGTTMIPLNLFTNLCVKRFPKKSFLESTLEILQQFEIKLESHEEFFFSLWETVQSTQ